MSDLLRDLVVLALVAAFFAICVLYVGLCDRIIGPDPGNITDDVHDDDHLQREVVAS